MVREVGKHQRSKQTGYDICLKVLDSAHRASLVAVYEHAYTSTRFGAGSTPKIAHKNIQLKELCQVS